MLTSIKKYFKGHLQLPILHYNNTRGKAIQAQGSGNSNFQSAISQLRGLSQESQIVIASLIKRLADAEGVSSGVDIRPPLENIGHWLTKLRSERKSERTINLYEYLVRRMLLILVLVSPVSRILALFT